MSRGRPARPRGSQAASGRFGVIDIGSNSIRLVVFDRLSRAPLPVFNERVQCGLGRDMADGDFLNPEGVELAVENLGRFVALARRMDLDALDTVATAAVRNAADGAEFVERLEIELGLDASILSGEEEAELSALGLLAGIPDAHGVMGDLGGGSLELVSLHAGVPDLHATLPLGPLRLARQRGSRRKAQDMVEAEFDALPWLGEEQGHALYLIGGAWRAVARLHMAHIGHPLTVIHHYAADWDGFEDFLRAVSNMGPESLDRIGPVSRRRRGTLPIAAQVMLELGRRVRPETLVFSAFGLREGCVYRQLPARVRRRDPLIEGCREMAERHGRFRDDGAAVERFVAPLLDDWPEADLRLAKAAALIADIAWAEHPDYRAAHAAQRVLTMQLVGVDHRGRALLAMIMHARYAGSLTGPDVELVRSLLDSDEKQRALVYGLALRLAATLGGGVGSLLTQARLKLEPGGLILAIPAREWGLVGEMVRRRLDALAEAMGRSALLPEPTRRALRRAEAEL